MKLLICTQKVDINDSVLGFFHRWIEEFAKHCEQLIVVCLEEGEHHLPENVKVFSLGKEKRQFLNCYIAKLLYCWRFYKYIWKFRKDYDSVFIHMNSEYVVLAGFLWKILVKKVAIWYTHKATNWRLHFATIFVDNICTASLESCHINSKKINIFGHGIDGEKFYCKSPHLVSDKLKILTVGRISPIKNLNLMIESVKELKEREKKVALNIVGGPVNKLDSDYLKSIKNLIAKNDLEEEINFLGEKKYDELAEIYCEHNIFLHCSDTGSLDKVVLEAGLCGLLIVTTSIAYQNFPLTFVANKPDKIASAIISQVDNPFESLRECVLENHSLANLIKKIIKLYA